MAKSNTIELIEQAHRGDDRAKELVVSQNLGLVWSIVHRFKNNYYDKEDLFQIGCIGLMKAVNNFDTNYGVQFSTYAVPIIMGEIKRYFRDDGTIKVSRSLKELNLKINKARELLTNQTGQDPTVEQIALEMEIDKLDEKEKLILYMRYQLDFNQERVAQRLNISQVQVSRLEKKIIAKLRSHLNEQ